MSSCYQLNIADFYSIATGTVKKLLPNFFDKENYVLHYKNLQLYLELVLKLKIHQVLRFNQSQWLKQYVKFNIQKKN